MYTALCTQTVLVDLRAQLLTQNFGMWPGVTSCRNVAQVAKKLEDSHAEVRRLAALVLGRLGVVAAVHAKKLASLLHDVEPKVRAASRNFPRNFQDF